MLSHWYFHLVSEKLQVINCSAACQGQAAVSHRRTHRTRFQWNRSGEEKSSDRMILPPHHTLNFLSLSIEKSIKCRTGPGNDFVAICKFGNFPQRLQKQNANDLWDNILQKDKWEADEGLPWSAPQFPSKKNRAFTIYAQTF